MTDFLTLTYNREIGPSTAKRHLHSFLTALKKRHKGIRYIWAQEFQGNGRIHFHILVDQELPTRTALVGDEWKQVYDSWPHGLSVVTKVDYAVGLASYLTSEVSKTNQRECHYLVGRWWGYRRGIVFREVTQHGFELREALRFAGVGNVEFGWRGNLNNATTLKAYQKLVDSSK